MRFLVRSAICALYPRTEDLPGAADCDIDAFLKRFQEETTSLVWLGVVIGALVFHLTPILTVFVPLPARLLPKRLLDRHAHAIGSSRSYLVRQAIFVLKLPAGLSWGAHPRVRERFALAPLEPDSDQWRKD